MSEEIVNQEKKVIRRSVANAKGTTRLKFSHEQVKPNGLFLAHLDSCVVSDIKVGEDKTGMPSFNGLEIPKLVITFASNEEEIAKRHYVTLQFNAVESNVNTIPGGSEEWKVNTVFDWLKHILNVYLLKGREFTEEESQALSLSYIDFDENGEYTPVEPEVVIAAWRTLFNNFENILNRGNNGQPCYKQKDGKMIPIYIKLLRYIKQGSKGWKAINNGELAFPAFVGEGCIELYKANVVPSLRVNTIRECILPMNIEKPKAPNMPVVNMGVASIPMNEPMNQNFDNISMAAMDDMPF